MLREQGVREDVFVSSEVGQEKEATCIGSSEPHTLGPLDKWARAIDPKLSTSESLQQQRIHQALWDGKNTPSATIYCKMGIYSWCCV
ncbi:hypothetical protein LINPERPRIM_LOCUS21780 [Linum perenne]